LINYDKEGRRKGAACLVISDGLYGQFEIDEVLERIIGTKPVQRLKGIHQGGASYLVNPKWNVSRYEHSIGVMLLIRKLGGSVQEQIAGLLHDVSHTAFSHVIDFALENSMEDYHEKIYRRVIEESEIPSVLGDFGFNWEDLLLDDSHWTLLEQHAPELCADRIDYTLRDMYRYGYISSKEVRSFLNELIVINGRICLGNVKAAQWFVQIYIKEVIGFFMDSLNIFGYDRLASALKLALNKGVICLDDLLRTDDEVLTLIKSSKDSKIKRIINQIHEDVIVKEDPLDYNLHRKTKPRLIDPSVRQGNELVKASVLSKKIKDINEAAARKMTEGIYIKVVSYERKILGGNGKIHTEQLY
jgi:uncharacterized protein